MMVSRRTSRSSLHTVARSLAPLSRGHPVAAAARRALAHTRETISDLSVSREVSTRDALEAVALEQRDRFGIEVDVDAPSPTPSSHLPFGKMSFASLARRSPTPRGTVAPSTVVVSLTRREGGSELLRVHDDGCGITGGESNTVAEGFGLRSMRDRAAGFGGALRIRRATAVGPSSR